MVGINLSDWNRIKRRISKVNRGGMNVDNYDPDKDKSGMIGIRLADLICRTQRDIDLEREMHDVPYRELYDCSRKINAENIFADGDRKREILTDLFPNKFGAGAKQDLRERGHAYIGKIFKNIYAYAKRIAEEAV